MKSGASANACGSHRCEPCQLHRPQTRSPLSPSLSFSPLLLLPFTKRISFDLQTRDFFFFSFLFLSPQRALSPPTDPPTRSSRTAPLSSASTPVKEDRRPDRTQGERRIEKEKNNQVFLFFLNFAGSIGGEFVVAATSRGRLLNYFYLPKRGTFSDAVPP